MAVSSVNPTTSSRRHYRRLGRTTFTTADPHGPLTRAKAKITGRNHSGRITVRHRGGGEKRRLRLIDFKRTKHDIPGKVVSLEYDPNRSANIALVNYADGDKRYLLAPDGLQIGHLIMAGHQADILPGNALPLSAIPVGTPIHNLELRPGKGGQLVRGAGSAAYIQSKEKLFAAVLLPSKEVRLIPLDCYATIGQVSNPDWKTLTQGKAGRRRHRGFRPSVRGTAQHPDSHPHGGGEGRSGIGLVAPKTPWGKRTLGKKTRKRNKYSNHLIIKDRRRK